jgi:hypothetical protein
VQQAAPWLVDAIHDSRDAIQGCGDRRFRSHVDLAAASTMTDLGCHRLRLIEVASGHDNRILGRQFRRDAPPDDAVAAGDENVLPGHGSFESLPARVAVLRARVCERGPEVGLCLLAGFLEFVGHAIAVRRRVWRAGSF